MMTAVHRNIAPAAEERDKRSSSVWRAIALQCAVFATLCAIMLLLSEALSLRPADSANNLLIAVMLIFPPALWLAINTTSKHHSARSRRRLIEVAVLSALVAAAIGRPIMQDFFRLEEWLPLESVFSRMLGFAMTAGILDAGLKLLVLRFTIYPHGLRERSDALAYGFASAIGYTFYLNMAIAAQLQPSLSVAATYALANAAMQFASAMFIALGLVESYFGDAFPLVLPLNVLVAAASTGIIAPLFTSLMSGSLSVAGSTDRPLFGLLFLCAGFILFGAVCYFLYSVSQRREREAYHSRREPHHSESSSEPSPPLTPRQRWSMVFSFSLIAVGLLFGISLRDSSLGRSTIYTNIEAGITARYPYRWLIDEGEDFVFRVQDTAQRGFNTLIEVKTLPVGPDTSERNLLDRLTLRRSQTLIDYNVLGYDIYVLPDETAAVTMAYSFVSRDASPFLEGLSAIVAGLDILTISRGQALIISFRADASIYEQELATLDWFIDRLEY